MRAAVLQEVGAVPVVRDDVEIEDPHDREVLVRVRHCGVCHSDLSLVDGVLPAPLPVVLGHEAAGIVEAVGPGVTLVSVGDPVVLTPCPPCGRCAWCVRGQPSLCIDGDAIVTATHPDGGTRLSRQGTTVHRGLGVAAFAEQVVIQETGAIPVPPGVPLEEACLVGCAVQTGVGAVLNTAGVEAGDTVLIMGLGGVGLSVVQGARLAGASRILVSDPLAQRRALALELGATDAVDPSADDAVAAALDITAGMGVDWAFDAAGRSALVMAGIDATRKGGTTVMVGVPPLDDPLTIPLPAMLAAFEKRLIGSLLGSCHARRDIPRFLELARTGHLDLRSLVSAHRPLEEIGSALDDLRSGTGVRTIIDL